MNGDDFIASLRLRLGQRSAVDIPSAQIIVEAEALRKTQLEKAKFKPWFLQNEDTSLATVIAQEWAALPAGFLGFDPDDEWSGVWYQDPSDVTADPWVKLVLDDFNSIRDFYKASTVASDSTSAGIKGTPVKAGLFNARLYLRPIPDKVYNLRYRFYKSDSAMTETPTENLWLQHAHDWLMGEVGYLYATQFVQNPELVPIFEKLRMDGRLRVYHETIARQEAGKARQQGDD